MGSHNAAEDEPEREAAVRITLQTATNPFGSFRSVPDQTSLVLLCRVFVTPTLMELFGGEVRSLVEQGHVAVTGKLPPAPAPDSWLPTAALILAPTVYLALFYYVFKKSQETSEDVRGSACSYAVCALAGGLSSVPADRCMSGVATAVSEQVVGHIC